MNYQKTDRWAQVVLVALGVTSAWLISSASDDWRKAGFVIALINQPVWIFTAYIHKQKGVMIMAVYYTVCWVKGLVVIW